MNTVHDFFKKIPDPRVSTRCLHRLDEILFIAFCTLLSNGEDYQDMVDFAEIRESWLRNHLELPNGIPSYDTFRRVFELIDPKYLRDFLAEDAADLLVYLKGSLISLDGKKLRGMSPKSKGNEGFFLLHAWVNERQVCIGQTQVKDKSNEITAIPKLLDELSIEGATIRIDAIGCQREIVAKIVEKGGNYLISLKKNQLTLFEFAEQAEIWEKVNVQDVQTEMGHGRWEQRVCRLVPADVLFPPALQSEWANLRAIVGVDSQRKVGDKLEKSTRYYISNQFLSPEEFNYAVRTHWGIENGLHFHLDITFREDACRVRTKNAAENLAILRRVKELKKSRASQALRRGDLKHP